MQSINFLLLTSAVSMGLRVGILTFTMIMCGAGFADAIWAPEVYETPEFLAQNPPIEYVEPTPIESPCKPGDSECEFYRKLVALDLFIVYMYPGSFGIAVFVQICLTLAPMG